MTSGLAGTGIVLRPTWRFVLRHPAHFIALAGGVGLAPVAPGTFGTLAAVPLYWAANTWLAAWQYLLLVAALFAVGVWACDVAGRAIGAADHGAMVWDETVAFMIVLFFVPARPSWQVAAFVVFRAFDILKPPPIRYYERTFKNGFGVMLDDIVAAFHTLVIFAVAKVIMA